MGYPNFGADLAIFNDFGEIAALVEVKAIRDTKPNWATEVRTRMFGRLPRTGFFLIVTSDQIYLWPGTAGPKEPPSLTLDARPLLAPYFERSRIAPEKIWPEVLEMLVGNWLGELAIGLPDALPSAETAGVRGLRDSGFLDAIRGGRIAYEDAA